MNSKPGRAVAAVGFLLVGFVLLPMLQLITGDLGSPLWWILVIAACVVMAVLFLPLDGEAWARRLLKNTELAQPEAVVCIVRLTDRSGKLGVLSADDTGVTIVGETGMIARIESASIQEIQDVSDMRINLRLLDNDNVEFIPMRNNGVQTLTIARLDALSKRLRAVCLPMSQRGTKQ